MAEHNRTYLVNKEKLTPKGFQSLKIRDLDSGAIRFKIQKYAFTSNNLTYAVVGYRVRYWEFFPAEDPWGIIPVWGFAEVVASNHEAIQVGEQFYGYFPMADYLDVSPSKVNDFGFTDQTPHRQELASIYNYYSRVKNDLNYKPEVEDYIPLIRPLFITGFLNYYFLKEEHFEGIEQIVLTSASSKTALSLAYMLKINQTEDHKNIIGITSQSNMSFVKASGYYDQVISYDQFESNLENKTTVIVDFAGNSGLLQQIADLLNDHLKYISLIGLTDWQAEKGFKSLPNAHFFFAPTQAQKQFGVWGVEETNKKIAQALFKFINEISKSLKIQHIHNEQALTELYTQMLQGKVDPSLGYIIIPN